MTLKPGSDKKMAQLQKAVSAHYDNDNMQFRSAVMAVTGIEDQIQGLRDSIGNTMEVGVNGISDAGVASKHRSWVEHQIKELNIEMARALVEVEEARVRLAVSSAKCEIVKRIKG